MKKLLAGLGFSVVITSGLFANSLMMATQIMIKLHDINRLSCLRF
jgi:hypothetical protein